ncbi:MAG: ABC transporter ATP-binding protein [Deltaproteobacteria bacterium]|nr:ABC transporter ATP-binding protein [Deltaproteobacteria bacterium]
MSAESLLVTESLTKRFGGRCVVDGVSLEVNRGDVFGFLGPNGAGKSTTMRMILGLVRASSGTIRVAGIDVGRDRRAALAKVGAVVEGPAFYDHLSGWENLEIFTALGGGATRARMEEALEIVGLRGREGDPVDVYSTGMRQRLGIAQALLPHPEIILLDEPGNGLDPRGSLEIRALIRQLSTDHGLTIFLSSHLLHEVEQLCDRVAILDRGHLLYQGSVAGLLTRASYLRVVVESPAAAGRFLEGFEGVQVLYEETGSLTLRLSGVDPAWVNARLVEKGFRVQELRQVRESLENIFLRLTGGEREAAA